jgi:MoaA/NifB/PqqE/SkfB family radical SAM enzyme
MAEQMSLEFTGPGRDDEMFSFSRLLSRLLRVFFRDAVRVSIRNPMQALFFLRTVVRQRKAARVRSLWREQGLHVPPIVIFSVTNRCNLHCKGCYSWALHRAMDEELSDDMLNRVFEEARELGISFFVLAGGEPFVRSEIIDIIDTYREMIFLVFTNGLLIDESMLARLKKMRNIVPVVSLEGFEKETDMRRGDGVFQHLQRTISVLKRGNVFYSVSITLTRNNYPIVTDEVFIQKLVSLGCKLFFFVEYSPIQEGTEDWVITEAQREGLMDRIRRFRETYRSLFIAVPGDEEEIGGCLSAGRGFVHINANGDLEPCPFAPYSDVNLKNSSLKEALQSKFLGRIRHNHDQLSESEGGCALWVQREWVRSLLNVD